MTGPTRAEVETMARRALTYGGAYSFGEEVHDTLLALLARAEAAEATLVSVLDKVRREHEPAQKVCEALWAYEYGDADTLDLQPLFAWRATQARGDQT